MKRAIVNRISQLHISLADDSRRRQVQFFTVYLILSFVSVFMTIVNAVTQKYTLMLATLLFALANFANLFLSVREGVGRKVASVLFSAEITALFTFFIISGNPEGFSVIWVCMLPASGLLLFGKKRGSALCALELAIMVFFFYLPFGRALLRFDYTESFCLRFPMLYVAFFAVAFFLETIREGTYHALQKSKRQYQHLYSHDALTNVYNRYGFDERMDALLQHPCDRGLALMILDIDCFKKVNDRYGHPTGDTVLKEVAALLVRESGEDAFVCRWGGEEFAVILPSAVRCEAIANRVQDVIRALNVSAGDETVHVTASIGLVIVPPHSRIDTASLVMQTDRCLYKAKDAGKNRIMQRPYNAAIAS